MPIPLDTNVIGKVILEDIRSKQGTLLMKAGVVLTKSLVERLQKNNIVEVSVEDEIEAIDEVEGILENG